MNNEPLTSAEIANRIKSMIDAGKSPGSIVSTLEHCLADYYKGASILPKPRFLNDPIGQHLEDSRAVNLLDAAGYYTIRDLLRAPAAVICGIDNFGLKHAQDLVSCLHDLLGGFPLCSLMKSTEPILRELDVLRCYSVADIEKAGLDWFKTRVSQDAMDFLIHALSYQDAPQTNEMSPIEDRYKDLTKLLRNLESAKRQRRSALIPTIGIVQLRSINTQRTRSGISSVAVLHSGESVDLVELTRSLPS